MSQGETFLKLYEDVMTNGQVISPRGEKVLEIEDYQFTLDPYERFTSFNARKLSLKYIKAELIWYLRANPYDTMITEHAQIWTDLRQPDGQFFSNYGQYLFDQNTGIFNVMETLVNDKDSRRAIISLLQPKHLFIDNKDVVCTYNLSFRIRNNKLNMSVNMRSNDAVWGTTNDVAAFSFVHEMLFTYLKDHYIDLELGTYTHKVDSIHIYERHFEMAKAIIDEGTKGYYELTVPKMKSSDELEQLLITVKSGQFNSDYESEESSFTNWLLS